MPHYWVRDTKAEWEQDKKRGNLFGTKQWRCLNCDTLYGKPFKPDDYVNIFFERGRSGNCEEIIAHKVTES